MHRLFRRGDSVLVVKGSLKHGRYTLHTVGPESAYLSETFVAARNGKAVVRNKAYRRVPVANLRHVGADGSATKVRRVRLDRNVYRYGRDDFKLLRCDLWRFMAHAERQAKRLHGRS